MAREAWSRFKDWCRRRRPRGGTIQTTIGNIGVALAVGLLVRALFWLLGKMHGNQAWPDPSIKNFAVILAMLGVPALWRTIQYYRHGLVVAVGTLERWRFLAPALLLCVIATGSIVFVAPGTRGASIGSAFPFVVAFVTTAGFLFTLNKLDDILSRITRYEDLVRRCSEMIAEEIRAVANGGRPGHVYIVANAVTFGNISAQNEYRVLLERLSEAFNNEFITVRIICGNWNWWVPEGMNNAEKRVPIKPGDVEERSTTDIKTTLLGSVYWGWEGSGDWDEQKLKKPYYQAIALLDVLRKAQVSSEHEVKKQVYVFSQGYAPLHMVITSARALLFHVIDFPLQGNHHPPAKIHVIGTETGDAMVMERLERAFDYHANNLSSRIDRS